MFKCFHTTTGSLRPCVVKMVPLSVRGTFAVEEEYNRPCAVLHIPGTVKVLQRPLYTATHGFGDREGDLVAERLQIYSI